MAGVAVACCQPSGLYWLYFSSGRPLLLPAGGIFAKILDFKDDISSVLVEFQRWVGGAVVGALSPERGQLVRL